MLMLRIMLQSVGKLEVYSPAPNSIGWESLLEHTDDIGLVNAPQVGAEHPPMIRRMLGQRELQLLQGKGQGIHGCPGKPANDR